MRIAKVLPPRPLLALVCLFTAVLAANLARAQASPVTLTPALVQAGSPELIRVEIPNAVGVDGEWMDRKLEFFRARDGHTWFSLAGADVEASAGSSTLLIHVRLTGGDTRDLTRTVEIHPARYRTGALSVAPKFIEPGPEALKQIDAESKLKADVFAHSAAQPLWQGSFHAPVTTKPTDSFGTRRMFNGKLASIHKGADFRAATGTPVRASNSGIVVLARPLYFEGNCVVIDHGQGLFTLSMHFSRIDVHEGQHVKAGDRLGLSGATGRVTGPHLHWAVRWQRAYLDPVKLLQLNLNAVP